VLAHGGVGGFQVDPTDDRVFFVRFTLDPEWLDPGVEVPPLAPLDG
jgi:hypothetical protein